MMSSFVGRGNQYIQVIKVLSIGKKLPTFPHRVHGLNRRPQRWPASVSTLPHHGARHPLNIVLTLSIVLEPDFMDAVEITFSIYRLFLDWVGEQCLPNSIPALAPPPPPPPHTLTLCRCFIFTNNVPSTCDYASQDIACQCVTALENTEAVEVQEGETLVKTKKEYLEDSPPPMSVCCTGQ